MKAFLVILALTILCAVINVLDAPAAGYRSWETEARCAPTRR